MKLLRIFISISCLMLFFGSCDSHSFSKGQEVYNIRCASCHMPDGSGLQGNIPSLAKSDYLKNNQGLVCVILKGVKADPLDMPAHVIEDIPLTNLINFMQHEFLQKDELVRLDSVKTWRSLCQMNNPQ